MRANNAYVVIFINKTTSPPIVEGCGIFSERSPSTHLGTYQTAVIVEIGGDVDTYHAWPCDTQRACQPRRRSPSSI